MTARCSTPAWWLRPWPSAINPWPNKPPKKFSASYHATPDGGYFNRPDDYYGNNWAWFGLATYRGLVIP